MFCFINKESGKLGKATTFNLPLEWINAHPDTGVVFDQQTIPDWGRVCRDVLKLAAGLPDLPHIAWDIALLDDDIAIIEANGWSHGAVFQMEKPLLTDTRVKSFYKHHGVL